MTPADRATPPISTTAELVAAREARGLSAADMQRQLKLHPSQLEALERGEWDALPGLSFVRGMLRAYARVLEVDVEPLLAAIGGGSTVLELHSSSLSEPIRKAGMLGFDHGGSGSGWTWIVLTIVALVALAMFFGRSTPPPSGSATTVPVTAGPAGQTAAVSSYSVELELKQTDGRERLLVKVAPNFGVDGDRSPVVVIAPVPAKLVMTADSWVEAVQVDGRVLLVGDQKAGAVSELTVNGMLTVTSPFPAPYRLEFDGRQIPLELPAGSQSTKVQLQ